MFSQTQRAKSHSVYQVKAEGFYIVVNPRGQRSVVQFTKSGHTYCWPDKHDAHKCLDGGCSEQSKTSRGQCSHIIAAESYRSVHKFGIDIHGGIHNF